MQVVARIRYRKLREIGVGEGRNSRVYLANEPQLGGRVAIKEIQKRSFRRDIAAYFREAQVMFRATHPNVVTIRYACQTPRKVCLAMPYYQRGSLAKRIADHPLQLGEVLRVTQGILAGLAHIHRTDVHFDVKPSNVLFSDINVPMLADFGQSRSISATGVVNAPGLYWTAFPPEVHASGVGSPLCDIYQVGLLLYRALNGDPLYQLQVPADGAVLRRKISKGTFPNRDRFMPHVPKRLRTIVRKALRVDPAERYRSATEMADVLSRVRLGLDWTVSPLPNGGLRWTASRTDHADLIVELLNQGAVWNVETFTQNRGRPRRRKDAAANWRRGLSLDDAYTHLNHVFERLQG